MLVRKKYDIKSIAISRDSDFVALALGERVHIYDLTDLKRDPERQDGGVVDPKKYAPKEYTLTGIPKKDNIQADCQKVGFSSDGMEVITATLDSTGNIHINLCDRNGEDKKFPLSASKKGQVRTCLSSLYFCRVFPSC